MSKTPENDIISELTRGPRWSILKAMDEPSTSNEIAQKTGLTHNNVTYHMKALVKVGVVKVFKHPDNAARRVYQRQPVFAEICIDYDDDGTLVTSLSCVVSKATKPKNLKAVDA